MTNLNPTNKCEPPVEKTGSLGALVAGEVDAASLPADRPILSFVRWGAFGGEARYGVERGFYLGNNGGPAFEVSVEPFFILRTKTVANTIARIGTKEQGFAPISLEGVYTGSRWELDVALGIEAGTRIKGKKMARFKSLCVPVSVVYRDGSSHWYRSDCMMTFSSGRIDFSSVIQKPLGPFRPL